MTNEEIGILTTTRAAVGLLGEKQRSGWWPSAFFSKAAGTFLSPLFPRTQLLAQTNGVTAAAALLHDDRIGVGQVFHLFRLPEDIEQAIQRTLADDTAVQTLNQCVASPDSALQFLRDFGAVDSDSSSGPVRIGDLGSIRSLDHWKMVAAVYAKAFEKQQQSFPYFSDQS